MTKKKRYDAQIQICTTKTTKAELENLAGSRDMDLATFMRQHIARIIEAERKIKAEAAVGVPA